MNKIVSAKNQKPAVSDLLTKSTEITYFYQKELCNFILFSLYSAYYDFVVS